MESAQNEYQKKMAEEAQKQLNIFNLDKLKSKGKLSWFSYLLLRPKNDVDEIFIQWWK